MSKKIKEWNVKAQWGNVASELIIMPESCSKDCKPVFNAFFSIRKFLRYKINDLKTFFLQMALIELSV